MFGGSFDPVHTGHLTIAQDAVEQLRLDRLIFVPAAVPPHKQGKTLVDGHHRFEMLRLATEGVPKFEVSGMELKRGGISYSFDTMMQVREEHPGARLFFIVGIDSLAEFHLWRNVESLLELCTVVPFARGGEKPEQIAEQSRLPEEWKKRLFEQVVRTHEVEVSSSEIRRRIAAGLSIRTLVPPKVELYIAEHGLYG